MVQGYESPNMSQAMEGMSRRKKMIVRIMTLLLQAVTSQHYFSWVTATQEVQGMQEWCVSQDWLCTNHLGKDEEITGEQTRVKSNVKETCPNVAVTPHYNLR
jgi:hypothetical protein